jgi:hypothetical protein
MSSHLRQILQQLRSKHPLPSAKREALAHLEQEMRLGFVLLRRRRELPEPEDSPELREEILHEAIAELLDPAWAPDAKPGAGLRMLTRAARRLQTRLLRATPTDNATLIEIAGGTEPTVPRPSPQGLRSPPSCDWDELLSDPELRMANGRLHVQRLSLRTGISEKEMRAELRDFAARLGHDGSYTRFWLHRLRDALLHVFEGLCERSNPRLLPGVPPEEQPRARLMSLLARVSRCGLPSSRTRPLQQLRALLRGSELELDSRPALRPRRPAARGLPLPRSCRRSPRPARRRPAPTPPSRELELVPAALRRGRDGARRPREQRLLLARAAAFATLGRPDETLRLLRRIPASPRDPLVLFNRLLAARELGDQEECRAMQRLLRSPACDLQRLAPLLRQRIRRLLADR